MSRIKVALIGAGSYVFGLRLAVDLISYPELKGLVLSLMDIDRDRLEFTTKLVKIAAEQSKAEVGIHSTTDRREALKDADYVVTSIRAGGMEATRLDLEIPAKYGIEQGVGDTIGPGGVFYGLRNGFALLEICKDMEDLCPDAWLLNYTNPMAILCWVIKELTKVKFIGLCHSVPNTAHLLASYIGAQLNEISYLAAGINHMAWFIDFRWRGVNAYPILREKFSDPSIYDNPNHPAYYDLVRIEIFKALGYYVSESSNHLSEYLPYFRKNLKLIERYRVLSSSRRLEVQEKSRRMRDEKLLKILQEGEQLPLRRSGEYCAQIVYAIETNTPTKIYGNVENTGLITNLPYGCIVEVPCVVDGGGIHPCYIGSIPSQCAALNRMNINVQELAARAIIERSRERVFQALLVDPLTSSLLTIDEIRRLTEEMFEAQSKYLPKLE
ncbi:MAG: alpha-galactosidase [Candidatus Bathyarchaeia archaeon]|nr:alpha-galactosidase [Candidatus Bathyarchaeota archaeon]